MTPDDSPVQRIVLDDTRPFVVIQGLKTGSLRAVQRDFRHIKPESRPVLEVRTPEMSRHACGSRPLVSEQ